MKPSATLATEEPGVRERRAADEPAPVGSVGFRPLLGLGYRGPKDQINISIPHSGSKAQCKGDTRNTVS